MLSNDLKNQIQTAYRRFLEAKSLHPRYGQRLMIAEVARTLGTIAVDEEDCRVGDPAVLAIEAGTGTGKTVAYCLAAIPAAKAAGKSLVISTATVALQEQVVHKDLPDLLRNSGLSFSFALAKGRGRYLCLSRLDGLLQEGHSQQGAADLFAQEGFRLDTDTEALKLYTRMLERLAGNRWDGDRDSWPEALEDEQWSRLTIDHGQCTGRHCPNFQQCSFFKAREGMTRVDVIVTNHDMVLADLALGGGAILPGPRETLYVFDEGHHLPDKAIGHFAHFTRLRSTADWLVQIDRNLTRLLAQHPLPGELGRLIELVASRARDLQVIQQQVYSLCETLGDFHQGEDIEGRERPRHRFVGGVIPDSLREPGLALKQGFSSLHDGLSRITEMLKKIMDGEPSTGLTGPQAEEWYPLFGSLQVRAEGNWSLWDAFTVEDPADGTPMARWMTLVEQGAYDIELNASPILAAENLRRHLWQVAHGAVVTSATLTALGRFDRFRMRAGLPAVARTETVPSPFRHAEAGVLHVPNLGVDPRDAAAHTAAIAKALPELLAETRGGALVLFSSRRQMHDVFQALDKEWRRRILLQDSLSKQETLSRHRARIDEGQPSVLFGLASFAEGVDLPGAYCEHVLIARIPFAVPDDPVEAALAEWIEARGGNPFMEISVPDASLRLIQACGRLLRSETDTGVISLLDRRLVTQRYGRALLDALPPFRVVIDP